MVLDIPVEVTESGEGEVPRGGDQAQNSAGEASYTGPCPPEGTHHYRFTVHALSTATVLGEGAGLDTALRAVAENTIAWGRLTATYAR